jgi:hypothetical protein
VNSQTSETRAINQATQDFNNSLAAQLDEGTAELDSDAASKNQKDILGIGTAGGKIVSKAATSKTAKKGALALGRKAGFGKKTAQALSEGDELIGAGGAVEKVGSSSEEALKAVRAARIGESGGSGLLVAGNTLLDRAGIATGRATGSTARTVASTGEEAVVAGSKEGRAALEAAGKGALKGAALTAGKAAIAGAGGALDIGEDISNLASGKKGMEIFGSNKMSQIGNMLNIAGSTLEVGGVLTGGITPWSIGAEILGAGLGVVGSALELGGDMEAADTKKETLTTDIQSQARSLGGAQQVTTATARSN